jgi:hypothetical protein
LINKIPSPLLSHKSPYEVLFSAQPVYSQLMVFGCLCYANTLTRSRHKFDARAQPYVFLGYPVGIKGYKLYNLVSKYFIISRDVHFHETIFPFALSQHSSYVPSQTVFPLVITDSASFPISSPSNISVDASPPTISIPVPDIPNSVPVLDIPISSSSSLPVVPSRKSSRLRYRPGYLHNYHCNLADSSSSSPRSSTYAGIPYPISSFLSYNKLSSSHKHFSLSVSSIVEPQYYHQAFQHVEWRDAMSKEIQALELNNTWTVVNLPSSKRPIGCKWVYKVKLKSDGSIERIKPG